MLKCKNENLPQPTYFNKIGFHNELGQTPCASTDALPASFGIGLFRPPPGGASESLGFSRWNPATTRKS